ncbi:hypothetical protein GCM10011506_29300 [Marivirga lumbricoides]|uniref:Fibronectin type-III domain-containing protein n=1 Tax=Marivirga lumbricoides TaxID=1046115 RepID=A0ABQ1MK09_9BACT|nr:hypothetical protein GCM10011506_29300 [Marivirga lumbricoides]
MHLCNLQHTTNRKIKLYFFLLIIFSAFSLPVTAQQTAKTSDNGIGYLEYLPNNYNSNNNLYPAIIFLHGSGERGDGSPSALEKVKRNGPPKYIENGETMCFNNNGVQECFIVLSPQTSRWAWVGYEMIPFVQYALEKYRIDPDRVYLTGLSMGGEGTWKVAYSEENSTNYFAALAPIAGRGNYNDACTIADHELSVWAFHGDKDTAMSLFAGQSPINGMNNCGADPAPIFTVYEGVNHAGTWQRAYRTDNSLHSPNLYEWFLSQTKPNSNANNNNEPTAPTNLTSNSSTSNSIKLKWTDNSNNEDNFLIERSLSSNSNFGFIHNTNNNITNFEDTGLEPNTQYYYRIRAKNQSGYSSYSNILSVKTEVEIPNGSQNTKIVDNKHSSVTKVGQWSVSTAGGNSKYETDYLHDENYQKTGKKITFDVELAPGRYEVFAWWYAYENRASNTPFEIVSDKGTSIIYKNQRQDNARWVSLGTYDFTTNAVVNISNQNTNGFVVVDALKFEYRSASEPLPTNEIVLDNQDNQVQPYGNWETSSHGGDNKYEEDYFHDGNAQKGDKSVHFSASVASGDYEVFARWYAFSNRATNTPFEIVTSNGTETIYQNQQLHNAEWVSLGKYNFEDVAEVIIKNDNTDGYVVADAVKLVSLNNNMNSSSQQATQAESLDPITLDEVVVFPNPIHSSFSVKSPFKDLKPFHLKMRNNAGELEWEQTIEGIGEIKIDINRADISAGIKYLSIEVEGYPVKIVRIMLL